MRPGGARFSKGRFASMAVKGRLRQAPRAATPGGAVETFPRFRAKAGTLGAAGGRRGAAFPGGILWGGRGYAG
jgi:hypothetical protein